MMKITVAVDDTKLKPCPFCGGEAYIREEDIKGTAFVAVGAECKNAGLGRFRLYFLKESQVPGRKLLPLNTGIGGLAMTLEEAI